MTLVLGDDRARELYDVLLRGFQETSIEITLAETLDAGSIFIHVDFSTFDGLSIEIAREAGIFRVLDPDDLSLPESDIVNYVLARGRKAGRLLGQSEIGNI